ncbi:DUF899 family protein [Ectobacillus panaciterrae]|uniref:DUF899 family protein n=1 Tax=Ectobacillus panaciterrae TaxID=363872 RepID=UPI00042940E5|nr:DUF899 family protein [Ectobacillus panaciterrae]
MEKHKVVEREGVSVFYKDEQGNVFHTYSSYARGIDMLNAAYQFLDLVPKGRQADFAAVRQISVFNKSLLTFQGNFINT